MTLCSNVVFDEPIHAQDNARIDQETDTANAHEARLWASLLFDPSDILEIRCIPPKKLIGDAGLGSYRWNDTWRNAGFYPWFRSASIDDVVEQCQSFNSEPGLQSFWVNAGNFQTATNIYCSANPRRHLGGTKNTDVDLARCLFVDLDNVSVELASQQVTNNDFPSPSLTVASGHGVHLYWRLDQPIYDLALWTKQQKRLIQLFDHADTSIHDPARLMRLPGFMNLNGTPASCHIVGADNDRRFRLADIEAHLPPSPEEGGPSIQVTSQIIRPERLETISRALAYQEQVDPVGLGNRNSKLFGLAATLVEKFDLSTDDLHAVTVEYNNRLAEPLGESELSDVTRKAHDHVRRKDTMCGTAFSRSTDTEPCATSKSQVVSLDGWRKQMKDRRLESLQCPPAIHFDGSTTGAGKSTADLAAMEAAGRSVTFLPTHQACDELVEKLREDGLAAAAFPKFDERTCLRFGAATRPDEAQVAQSSGLDIGSALCPDCPLRKHCDYQKRRKEVRGADHVVATHARAAHSQFSTVQDQSIVFIHEDCRDLLRPKYCVTAKPVPNTPYLRHLNDIQRIAEAAYDIASDWHDDDKRAFAITLAESTKNLIDKLCSTELLDCIIKAEEENRLDQEARVRSLNLRNHTKRPDRLDLLLHRAMRATGIDANGEALRLCIAYSCGDLESLCLVVDDTFGKDGKRRFHQSLVGVVRVDLPENATVWLEDATGDLNLLADLARRPVSDRTPGGKLEYAVPPIQHALPKKADITLQTSGNVVRGVVRGLFGKYPDAEKIGIITHRVHLPQIENLEGFWCERIFRLDYFRSGNDRASNAWLDCDLLLVLGTPRVPPSAIRHALIQVGKIEDAGKNGEWGSLVWEAKTLNGEWVIVDGLGYGNPSWKRMHNILVRDLLLQAVGRGRCVTENGIWVVVVSSEPLGLPFSEDELVPIKDSIAKTFMAVTELSAISPTVNTVGEIAVSTAEVAELVARNERQVRSHLNVLSSSGLLRREGARGGWSLSFNQKCSPTRSVDTCAERFGDRKEVCRDV